MISDFHSDYSLCDADDAVVMKDIYPIPILIANSEFLKFRLNPWEYLIIIAIALNWPVLSNFII